MSHSESTPSDQPLPGSVSNQNGEEAEPAHSDGHATDPPSKAPAGQGGGDRDSGGAAGEGTQSTGNPASAG